MQKNKLLHSFFAADTLLCVEWQQQKQTHDKTIQKKNNVPKSGSMTLHTTKWNDNAHQVKKREKKNCEMNKVTHANASIPLFCATNAYEEKLAYPN